MPMPDTNPSPSSVILHQTETVLSGRQLFDSIELFDFAGSRQLSGISGWFAFVC